MPDSKNCKEPSEIQQNENTILPMEYECIVVDDCSEDTKLKSMAKNFELKIVHTSKSRKGAFHPNEDTSSAAYWSKWAIDVPTCHFNGLESSGAYWYNTPMIDGRGGIDDELSFCPPRTPTYLKQSRNSFQGSCACDGTEVPGDNSVESAIKNIESGYGVDLLSIGYAANLCHPRPSHEGQVKDALPSDFTTSAPEFYDLPSRVKVQSNHVQHPQDAQRRKRIDFFRERSLSLEVRASQDIEPINELSAEEKDGADWNANKRSQVSPNCMSRDTGSTKSQENFGITLQNSLSCGDSMTENDNPNHMHAITNSGQFAEGDVSPGLATIRADSSIAPNSGTSFNSLDAKPSMCSYSPQYIDDRASTESDKFQIRGNMNTNNCLPLTSQAYVFTVCDGHDGDRTSRFCSDHLGTVLHYFWHSDGFTGIPSATNPSITVLPSIGSPLESRNVNPLSPLAQLKACGSISPESPARERWATMTQLKRVFEKSFKFMDDQFRKVTEEENAAPCTAGSCVLGLLVAGPFVYCANVGDCRAALVTAKPLKRPEVSSISSSSSIEACSNLVPDSFSTSSTPTHNSINRRSLPQSTVRSEVDLSCLQPVDSPQKKEHSKSFSYNATRELMADWQDTLAHDTNTRSISIDFPTSGYQMTLESGNERQNPNTGLKHSLTAIRSATSKLINKLLLPSSTDKNTMRSPGTSTGGLSSHHELFQGLGKSMFPNTRTRQASGRSASGVPADTIGTALPPGDVGLHVCWLSREHRASETLEENRIKALGGDIAFGRISGRLEPSRTIGDFDVKDSQPPGVVSSVPDLVCCQIVRPSLILLGTDGVWDFINGNDFMRCLQGNRQLRNRVRLWLSPMRVNSSDVPTTRDLDELCDHLIHKARKSGSQDDATCTAVYLRPESLYTQVCTHRRH